MSDGEGTTENKKWAKGKWTAQGKVRATSFNRVTRDGFGNQMTLEQRPEGSEDAGFLKKFQPVTPQSGRAWGDLKEQLAGEH